MTQPQNDADLERLVHRSGVFRALRAFLLAADQAVASSAFRAAIPRRQPLRSLGILLLTAGATHGLLEALLPASTAPAGRYLFAAAAAIAGGLLLGASRSPSRV